jgi:hypothetical protein
LEGSEQLLLEADEDKVGQEELVDVTPDSRARLEAARIDLKASISENYRWFAKSSLYAK